MNLHFLGKLVGVVVLGIVMSACAPSKPQDVNSPAFAQRTAVAGRLTYLDTIKYIDDGLRYSDPAAAFFVSSDGRLCFRGVSTPQQTNLDIWYRADWCLLPTAVNRVDLAGTDQLNLSCKHADPQCIKEVQSSGRTTSTASVRIVPSDQEKAAVEHLIYLMGGSLGDGRPFY